MPRRFTPSLLRLAAAGLIGLSAAGCVIGEEFRHGYIIDDAAVAQVRPGASAEQVLQLLGTPTTVSTVGNKSWYYISQNTQRSVMFMGERPKDQRVLAVYFNAGFKVERVALYGEQDGKVFDFISRTTPTSGGEQAFLGQLMRGLTKFEPFGNAR